MYVSFGNSLLERLMSLATFIEGYRLARASGLIYTGDLSCKCGSSVISTVKKWPQKLTRPVSRIVRLAVGEHIRGT